MSLGDRGSSKEIVGEVSADFARRYAREHKLPFREELARYLVHGALHLFGHDDIQPAARKRMLMRQEAILKKVL